MAANKYTILLCLLLAACGGSNDAANVPAPTAYAYTSSQTGLRVAVDADAGIPFDSTTSALHIDLTYQSVRSCMRDNGWATGTELGGTLHVTSADIIVNGNTYDGWTDQSGHITAHYLLSIIAHEFVHYLLLLNTGSVVGSHNHPAFSHCGPVVSHPI